MKINQVHISDSLALFKKDFIDLWKLEPYTNPNEPCLFVGAYNGVNDINRINNHKGFKLVLFGGADIPNYRYLNPSNLFIVVDKVTYNVAMKNRIPEPKKFFRVAFKDYRGFKPLPLGDKIYCYQSMDSPACRKKYGFDMLERVIHYFGRDKVLIGYHGHTMDEMIEKYYSKSFINLQFNPMAGFTTTLEMAHLGRMSVSNYTASFCLSYQTGLDVIKRIQIVMNNKFVADPQEGFIDYSDEWLYTEYWKS